MIAVALTEPAVSMTKALDPIAAAFSASVRCPASSTLKLCRLQEL